MTRTAISRRLATMTVALAAVLGLLVGTARAEQTPQGTVSLKPKVRFTVDASALKKLGLPFQLIQSVNVTADGRRLAIVSHWPGLRARLTLLDSTTQRRVADIAVDLLTVNALALNDDGTQAMAVGEYAGKAVLVDIASGKSTPIFTRDTSRFRFSFPVNLQYAGNGAYIARGYTVDKDGVTQGDEIASLTVDASNTLAHTRLVDIGALVKGSGVSNGQLLTFNFSRDHQRLIYSVASSVTASTLFLGNLADGGVNPTKVLSAEGVDSATLGPRDAVAWCTVRRAGVKTLIEVDMKSAKTRTLGTGLYTPPINGADARFFIIGAMSPQLNRHDLFVGDALHRGALTPLVIDGWNGRLTLYSAASKADVFSLWSKDHIVVGTLGK